MNNSKRRSHVAFYIAFPIGLVLISFLLFFLLDMMKGPIYVDIIISVAVIGFAVSCFALVNVKMGFRFIPYGALLFVVGVVLPLAQPAIISKPIVEGQFKYTSSLKVAEGSLRGTYNADDSVLCYAGIPYAKAPVGDLRFREPQDAESWSGVRDCVYFAPRCPQQDTAQLVSSIQDIYLQAAWYPDLTPAKAQDMSEDCLYLNIWKPNTEKTDLPVLVYIHGGSLTNGSGAYEAYNGETMAKQGIVMVTIAYRLGMFGYFANEELKKESPNGTTGNYGLLDQIKALSWIHDNIGVFGGDASNITIAGESAGSSSVSAICSSPLAKGLFKRAIGESSSVVVEKAPHTFRELKEAYETGERIMDYLGAKNIADLRALPADKLVGLPYANSAMTVDGYALPDYPINIYKAGENNKEALLNGVNAREAEAFTIAMNLVSGEPSLRNYKALLNEAFGEELGSRFANLYEVTTDDQAYKAYNDIISSFWFSHPHEQWNQAALDNGETVYRYFFSKENHYLSTIHSGEMVYCYGNLGRFDKNNRYDESDYRLSKTMVSYWANFAKNGNPNGEGLPVWDAYTGDHQVLDLGKHVRKIEDPFLSTYPLLEEYYSMLKD